MEQIDSNGKITKGKKSGENDIIDYNPIGEDRMTEQLDEMSKSAYDAGHANYTSKKKKNNPHPLGSRKRAFFNQGWAHAKVNAKAPEQLLTKSKWITNKLRNEDVELLEAFDDDADETMTEQVIALFNEDPMADNRSAGSPEAPAPTTKTGILSQLSDWGLENKYVPGAERLEYSALKALVGNATKDTVNAVFKAALRDAANAKGVEVVDKNQSGQISEHIDAIFNGVELTEEGKAKVTLVFESAVAAVVKEEVAKIEEEAIEEIELRTEALETNLTEKMDQYLSYVAEQWATDNKLALESAIRAEIAEKFMADLKRCFEDNYIDVPASKIDALAEATSKVEDLTKKLDEQIKKNIEVSGSLNESKKASVLKTVSEGLALTEAEKLKGLVESVEFKDETDYATKVTQIKESYFKKTLNEEAEVVEKPKKTLTEDKDPKVIDWMSRIPSQPRI